MVETRPCSRSAPSTNKRWLQRNAAASAQTWELAGINVVLWSLCQLVADISKGDMQAADNLVDEEDDMHISEEEDEEADKMSLASDLDEEDLQEVLQREKELEKATSKKKK